MQGAPGPAEAPRRPFRPREPQARDVLVFFFYFRCNVLASDTPMSQMPSADLGNACSVERDGSPWETRDAVTGDAWGLSLLPQPSQTLQIQISAPDCSEAGGHVKEGTQRVPPRVSTELGSPAARLLGGRSPAPPGECLGALERVTGSERESGHSLRNARFYKERRRALRGH